MTQKIPFDPFLMWKEMYEHSEKAWGDIIQETLAQESFSEGLGKVQLGVLQYQEMINNLTELYFKQMNIPTRDEMANVATLIINVENKVDDLEDQLHEQNTAVAAEIHQLKRSMSSLEKKLDKVLTALTVLDQKFVTQPASDTTKLPEPKNVPKASNSNAKK